MYKKIKEIFCAVMLGAGFTSFVTYHSKEKKVRKIQQERDKYFEMFLLMNEWLNNKRKGKIIGDYLKESGLIDVAIYGMGYIGRNLYEELLLEDVNVKYLLDQNKNIEIEGRFVKTLDEEFGEVDAIIVTAIYNFEEIKKVLQVKCNSTILSLSDIIYKM